MLFDERLNLFPALIVNRNAQHGEALWRKLSVQLLQRRHAFHMTPNLSLFNCSLANTQCYASGQFLICPTFLNLHNCLKNKRGMIIG